MGDYIGITSGNGKIWPFWFDDKSGTMQAWTAGVQIETFPLNAYNLNSPAAGSRIATLQTAQQIILLHGILRSFYSFI
ncbi:MAG: hypothetical protein R2942_16835 [Ignavibacteria bacterium]